MRAGIYGRQSRDKTRSIDEQIKECVDDAQHQGWDVAETYSDGISASRFSTKARPDWSRLLGDLESLDVLVLWESSRGDRDAETWLGLLRRCREQRVRIRVTTHGRTYDMANARDWRTLAEDGVDSHYESEKISKRVLRNMAANAAAGKPHGPTPYGYERIYNPTTRKLVEQRPHAEQAPIVREIIERIGKGEPIVEVCARLNEREIPAPGGGKWHRSRVRELAINPAYIAKRRHHGELTDGIWDPLVDEVTFYRAQGVLTNPARKTTTGGTRKPGRTRHLLSYLAACGVCEERLHATRRGSGMAYHCVGPKGCTSVKAEWLDEYVTLLVIERLSRPDIFGKLIVADDSAVLAARNEAATLRARLDEYYDAAARGEVSKAGVTRIEAQLLPQIEAAEKRAASLATPPALRELLEPAGELSDRWEALSVAARKEVVRVLFAEIKLLPAIRPGTRHTTFEYWLEELAPERIDIEWRDLIGSH